MTVFLGDPQQPFVLLHNEVSLKPRSYVRVPVRYIPINHGDSVNELIAMTSEGTFHTRIQLLGCAHL
jgi:hypothetical protein